jgi:hypothetical protein
MSKCKTKEQKKYKMKTNKTQVNKVKKPLGLYIPFLSWSPLVEAPP